jgi:hypothetical protein
MAVTEGDVLLKTYRDAVGCESRAANIITLKYAS